MPPSFLVSDVCQAFQDQTIGSKIPFRQDQNQEFFLHALGKVVEEFDFTKCKVPGQGRVVMPKQYHILAEAGDGPSQPDPRHYVIRSWRGQPSMFLRREFAGAVNSLAVIVYTLEAYLADPDVNGRLETHASPIDRTIENYRMMHEASHVIVAVIASSGPETKAPPGYRTLVRNLSGGNNEWPDPTSLTAEDGYWKYKEAVGAAKATEAYWSDWSVVSD